MKFVRFLGFLLVFVPFVSFAASSSDFQKASKLLVAARQGDTQTVQILINQGANVMPKSVNGLKSGCFFSKLVGCLKIRFLHSLAQVFRQCLAVEEQVSGVKGHVVARHIPYTLIIACVTP